MRPPMPHTTLLARRSMPSKPSQCHNNSIMTAPTSHHRRSSRPTLTTLQPRINPRRALRCPPMPTKPPQLATSQTQYPHLHATSLDNASKRFTNGICNKAHFLNLTSALKRHLQLSHAKLLLPHHTPTHAKHYVVTQTTI